MSTGTDRAVEWTIDPDQLQPGDVLLVRSAGALSDLIAWLSNSAYSHAALLTDNDELVEALAGQGVCRVHLEDRLATPSITRIDVWRNQRLDGPQDQASVLACAAGMVGRGYALDQLVLLGLLMLVQDRPTDQPVLRWVAAQALRHLIDQPRAGVVCSELVYRCFSQVEGEPAGRLAPAILLPRPVNDTPFPKDFDWAGLIAQIQHLFMPRLMQAGSAAQDLLLSPETVAALAPGEDELEQLRQQALSWLEPDATAGWLSARQLPAASDRPPAVAPQLVAPQDLAASPDMRLLGTLLLRNAPLQTVTTPADRDTAVG